MDERQGLRLRPERTALRALGLLVVALALVGMHSLGGGSGSHSTAAPSMAPPAVSYLSAMRDAGLAATLTHDSGHNAMPMCLAVLVTLLALLLRTPRLRTAPRPAGSAGGRGGDHLSRPPPRPLLTQLCVLRT